MQVITITISVLMLIFVFFILAGLVSISNVLDKIVKHQNEMIKVLKNSKK